MPNFDLFDAFSSFFDLPVWEFLLTAYKSLAFVVSVLSIYGIIYVAIRSQGLRESIKDIEETVEATASEPATQAPISRERKIAKDDWDRIVNRLEGNILKDYAKTIIEADALVDYVLRTYGYPGETMGDRLKAVSRDQVPNIGNLWTAHKVRNEIAHDPNRTVEAREGRRIMEMYEAALKDLDAI